MNLIKVLLFLSLLFGLTKHTELIKCEPTICINGIFDDSSCLCKCFSSFTGRYCDCKIRLCNNAGLGFFNLFPLQKSRVLKS